jgi:Xaa-Pro aminopeptidase
VHTLPEPPPLPTSLDGKDVKHDKSVLIKALHEARSCKTEAEIAIMK